jgi:hypothetical protein
VSAEPTTRPSATSPEPPQIPNNSVSTSAARNQRRNGNSAELWLLRVRSLLFVTLCATFGVLLIILPWTPKWTDNPLLLSSPGLRDFVSSGFVRGLASGLGVLDLWLGFWEAIHYHENPRP